ncbi:hypothetical protein F5877DRAFT_68316 [Lentinula edodes]|nr:hypothetical protein F5877DRAFT_68316 [Lentinula edodes]
MSTRLLGGIATSPCLVVAQGQELGCSEEATICAPPFDWTIHHQHHAVGSTKSLKFQCMPSVVTVVYNFLIRTRPADEVDSTIKECCNFFSWCSTCVNDTGIALEIAGVNKIGREIKEMRPELVDDLYEARETVFVKAEIKFEQKHTNTEARNYTDILWSLLTFFSFHRARILFLGFRYRRHRLIKVEIQPAPNAKGSLATTGLSTARHTEVTAAAHSSALRVLIIQISLVEVESENFTKFLSIFIQILLRVISILKYAKTRGNQRQNMSPRDRFSALPELPNLVIIKSSSPFLLLPTPLPTKGNISKVEHKKLMFKRIERKRKRQEEEEALGLDEEVKEALGMGGVDSDSEESDDEESGIEENGDENEESEEVEEEEEGDSSDVDEEETEDVDMKIKDDSDSEEEKPPTISKRALKKQARQQKIQKIRERHAIWKKGKLQVASKVSSTLKTTPSTIKDSVAASRVDAAVDSAQNNNTGGLEKENGARPKSQTQSKSESKPDAAVTHVKGKAALKSPSLSSAGKSVAGDADVGAEGKKKQAATRTSKLNDAIVKKKKKENNGKRDIVLSNEGDINGYEREGAIAKVKPQKSSPTRTNTTVASAIPPKPKRPKHQNTPKDIDTKLTKKKKQ